MYGEAEANLWRHYKLRHVEKAISPICLSSGNRKQINKIFGRVVLAWLKRCVCFSVLIEPVYILIIDNLLCEIAILSSGDNSGVASIFHGATWNGMGRATWRQLMEAWSSLNIKCFLLKCITSNKPIQMVVSTFVGEPARAGDGASGWRRLARTGSS